MSDNDFQVAIEQFYRVSLKLRDEWQKEDIPQECHVSGQYLKRRSRKWMKVSSSWKKQSVSVDSKLCDKQETEAEESETEDDIMQLGNWTEDEAEHKAELEEEEVELGRRIYCQLEHNILYSRSYSVPVVYFNVFLPSGELLTLDDLWENSLSQLPNNQNNSWTFITQQEHPFLRRPFFHFHPCHTAELMKQVLHLQSSMSPGVYLLSWLSSIAPLVHLDLSLAYGHEIMEEPTDHLLSSISSSVISSG